MAANEKNWKERTITLLLLCLLGFCVYFCYANPLVLRDNFQEWDFQLLFLVYTIPNIVVCLIGGLLVDRVLCLRDALVLYTGLMIMGQLVFGLACLLNVFSLALVGHCLFGIGAETMVVAQRAYTAIYFENKHLNMAFGLTFTFRFLGVALHVFDNRFNFKHFGTLYKHGFYLYSYLIFSCVICGIALMCAVVLGHRHKCTASDNDANAPAAHTEPDWSVVYRSMGLFALVCISVCFAIYPLVIMESVVFFVQDSTYVLFGSVALLSAFVLAPTIGFVMDLFDCSVSWTFGAAFTTMLAHAIVCFTDYEPLLGVLVMCISYAIIAAGLWSIVALYMPQKFFGTTYGLCQAVQNFSIVVYFVTTDKFFSKQDLSHLWLHYVFIGILSVAVMFALILWVCNNRRCGKFHAISQSTLRVLPRLSGGTRQPGQDIQTLVE